MTADTVSGKMCIFEGQILITMGKDRFDIKEKEGVRARSSIELAKKW